MTRRRAAALAISLPLLLGAASPLPQPSKADADSACTALRVEVDLPAACAGEISADCVLGESIAAINAITSCSGRLTAVAFAAGTAASLGHAEATARLDRVGAALRRRMPQRLRGFAAFAETQISALRGDFDAAMRKAAALSSGLRPQGLTFTVYVAALNCRPEIADTAIDAAFAALAGLERADRTLRALAWIAWAQMARGRVAEARRTTESARRFARGGLSVRYRDSGLAALAESLSWTLQPDFASAVLELLPQGDRRRAAAAATIPYGLVDFGRFDQARGTLKAARADIAAVRDPMQRGIAQAMFTVAVAHLDGWHEGLAFARAIARPTSRARALQRLAIQLGLGNAAQQRRACRYSVSPVPAEKWRRRPPGGRPGQRPGR